RKSWGGDNRSEPAPSEKTKWRVIAAGPVPLLPTGERHERPGRRPGALPRLPGAAGPLAGRRPVRRQTRPFGRGPADPAVGAPGGRPPAGRGRGPGGVAAAGAGQQPPRRGTPAGRRGPRRPPRAVAGGGRGGVVGPDRGLAGGRAVVAE